MESRMEKYYTKDLSSFERTKKNQDLYKDISKEISDLENLPIPDNSNEIDLDGLKQIIYSRDEYRKNKESHNIEEPKQEEPKMREARIYDINVLLENAKNEINRSNEVKNEKKINQNFLTNLEEEKIAFEKEVLPENDDAIEISNMEVSKKEVSGDSLPLDILMDLKGNDNTIVTDPIVKDEVTMIKKIKDGETFYSGSFNFTKKDFDEEDDEPLIEEDNHTGLKITLIIIGILLLGVAIYFILTKYVL